MLLRLKNILKQRSKGAGFRLFISSFVVQEGERVAIIGPSGCGKSTTLDLLGMVLEPEEAELFSFFPEGKPINIAGLWKAKRIDAMTALRRRYLGYVLQTGELLPFLSVRENILLTAKIAGIAPQIAKEETNEIIQQLSIDHLQSHMPSSLSIGERQRTAIARALASRPRLLLADEPTAALDPVLSRRVMGLFLDIAASKKTTVIMVSHDINLVREFAFREVPIRVFNDEDYTTAVLNDGRQSWLEE